MEFQRETPTGDLANSNAQTNNFESSQENFISRVSDFFRDFHHERVKTYSPSGYFSLSIDAAATDPAIPANIAGMPCRL